MPSVLVGGLAVAVAATMPALDLAAVRGLARPSPERLAAEAELAAVAGELAGSAGWLLDAPVITLEVGPRRTPDGDDADLALGVDLPLAGDRRARLAAASAVETARRDLLAAADREATLALELAYVDAWEAGAVAVLRAAELAAAERRRAAVAARVEAGAEAPYEAVLAASEVDAARLAVVAAAGQREATWAALAARAAVGSTVRELAAPEVDIGRAEPVGGAPPGELGGTGSGGVRADVEEAVVGDQGRAADTLLGRAVRSREALTAALLALAAAREESRVSVLGSLAREGDEDVARLGIGYRLPLVGQRAARSTARVAAVAEARRRVELELARLDGRLAAARATLTAMGGEPELATDEVARALAALEARLAAGKDRPSDLLALRRQLLDAQVTTVARRAVRLRAITEIHALTAEGSP